MWFERAFFLSVWFGFGLNLAQFGESHKWGSVILLVLVNLSSMIPIDTGKLTRSEKESQKPSSEIYSLLLSSEIRSLKL